MLLLACWRSRPPRARRTNSVRLGYGVGGAALGALAGGAIGGNGRGALTGAAIGAVAGTLLGAAQTRNGTQYCRYRDPYGRIYEAPCQ
ncbi:lipoprotein [Brucella abortus str. 2308 A]|nr:lipoprotein [Brucella abortus str. 2308 A]